MIDALQQLPTVSLRSLATSLRDGPLSLGLTKYALAQIVSSSAAAVQVCLENLLKQGMTFQHVAVLVDAIADTRDRAADPSLLFELVLSGPDVPGVPTADTAATMQMLLEEAKEEVLLVGYAVHNGQLLFERLATRMRQASSLRATFCLEIQRKHGDTSLASEIVRRFAQEFRSKHWPWPELPELYYDTRSLAETGQQRSSLHAKCVVIDRSVAFITSANFTEAAQRRNIEAGVLVRYRPFVERLTAYFEALRAAGQLVKCCLQ